MRRLLMIFAWYLLISALTFLVFAWDKSQARRGGRRVSERTLHFLELIGGWPGALLGQKFLRHKSKKLSYRVELAIIVIVHMVLWLSLFEGWLDFSYNWF